MIQKWYASMIGALMAAVLLMAGCSNLIDPAEQQGSARGNVRLTLAGAGDRTLFPELPVEIKYKVEAAPNSNFDFDEETTQTIEAAWDGSGTLNFTLEPGYWSIRVTGYDPDSTPPVDYFEGGVGFTIENSYPRSLTIELNWIGSSGEGTFVYGGLTFPPGLSLSAGTLTLKAMRGPFTETFNLLTGYTPTSEITLDAGFYMLTVNLETADQYVRRSELVYIDGGKTTKISDSPVMTFTAGDFADLEALPASSVNINGILKVRETLTADTSSLGGSGPILYQWKRGATAATVDAEISGATGPSYQLSGADQDKYIAVTVSRVGYRGEASSAAIGQIAGPDFYWTAGTFGFSTTYTYSIAYGGGKFVAVGNSSNGDGFYGSIRYSTDGITWTAVADSTFGSSQITSIAYEGGKFIAGGEDGKMAYSADGVSWTAVTDSPFGSSTIWAIAYGNGKFIAGGWDGKMAYSADGITWTAVTDSTFGSSTIYSIAYGDGKFVAVGNSWLYGGIIRYSADGVTWTEVDSDSINSVFTHNFITAGTGIGDIPSIAYGGGKFVIGGLLGQMGYSADGVTWTEVADSPFDFTDFGMIRGITYGGGKFVAVGDHGQMGYSADGVTWTGIPAGTAIDGSTFGSNDRINSVAYGGTPGSEKFVAVESYSGGIAYTN